MFFTINELSLEKVRSRAQAIDVLIGLAFVSKYLFTIGFTSIRLYDVNHFKTFELSVNFRIIEWLKQKKYSSNQELLSSQILKARLDKTSLYDWTEADVALIKECPLITITHKGREDFPEGLKIAYLNKTIAVSLLTHPFWDSSTLSLKLTDEVQSILKDDTVIVRHVAKTKHIIAQSDWIAKLQRDGLIRQDWDPSKRIFPNLACSNTLVPNGDWGHFHDLKRKCKSDAEQRALIIRIGEKVAHANFYQLDRRVSALNKGPGRKRVIYSAGEGKMKTYLSLDLEKGGFEVCDHDGNHLGEFFYDGSRTSEAKPDHGIFTKS